MILISRVVTEDIHVKPCTFLDHGLANASCANHRDNLAGNLIAQKRQKRMPRSPAPFAYQLLAIPQTPGYRTHHEEGELRGGFR